MREIVSDIDSDHRHMTKFEGLKDPGFLSIVRTLHRWIADMKDPDKESCMFLETFSNVDQEESLLYHCTELTFPFF